MSKHYLDPIIFEKTDMELIKMIFDTPNSEGLHRVAKLELERRATEVNKSIAETAKTSATTSTRVSIIALFLAISTFIMNVWK